MFVTEEIPITVSRRAPDKKAWPSPYHYCSYLLGRHYHLTSIELWSAYFDLEIYTLLTHQQIPLLFTKSALSCWKEWYLTHNKWEIQPYLTMSKWNMGEIFGLKFHLSSLHHPTKIFLKCGNKVIFATEFVILCKSPPFYEVK